MTKQQPATRLTVAIDRAEKMGGRCLSLEYLGSKEPLQFECSNGHSFKQSFNHLISAKKWCGLCSGRIFDPKKVLAIITEKGGRLIKGAAATFHEKIEIECEKGHHFKSFGGNITTNKCWCPECGKEKKGPRLTIDEVKRICASRGGACLSDSFSNRRGPILCRCEKGHTWKSTAFALKYSGSWCHVCAQDAHKNDDDDRAVGLATLQRIAAAHNGKLLSREYVTVSTYYQWECQKGHQWSAVARNMGILGKAWCPECAGKVGETLSLSFIKDVTLLPFQKRRPSWLKGLKGKPLELDAYCQEANLAVEYQGKQHYEFVPGWHKTEEYFRECQARDALKRKLCAEFGVTLFEIPYVDRPTPEKIQAQIERVAREACLPYDFNPEYRAFKASLAAEPRKGRASR